MASQHYLVQPFNFCLLTTLTNLENFTFFQANSALVILLCLLFFLFFLIKLRHGPLTAIVLHFGQNSNNQVSCESHIFLLYPLANEVVTARLLGYLCSYNVVALFGVEILINNFC